jgi:regulator of sigma E protease
MTPILDNAWAVLVVVLLFGLVIFVHEAGHFVAARWLGLTVDTFSLGFGPALWKRRIGGVLYKIGIIPLGGYCAIPQLDPAGMETVQGGSEEGGAPARQLPPASPWRRIVVACAGPAGNVLLAVIIAWIIYLAPHAVTGGASTLVGTVETNAPAWPAGLRPGQVIERVNGERVATWYDFLVECHLAGDPARGVVLTVRDGPQLRDLRVPLATNLIPDVNVVAGVGPKSTCRVDGVVSNSVAAAAGVRPDDTIRSVNGVPVFGATQFLDYMRRNGSSPVHIEFVRGGEVQSLTLAPRPQPETRSERPIIGVIPGDEYLDVPVWMQYSKPWRQIKADASAVFRLLRALFFPQHKGEAGRAAGSVRGVPTIVVALWNAVQTGILNSLGLVRLIGINLAILNLLPIPVLDGGHVLFALWELIARRKPNARVVAVLVNVFAVLIIGLMLLLVVRDPHIRRPAASAWTRLFGSAPAPAGATPATNAAPGAAATEAAPAGGP